MKHDMPNEWNLLKTNYSCPIKIDNSYLPYLVNTNTGAIANVSLWSTQAIDCLTASGLLHGNKIQNYNNASIQSKDFTLSCVDPNNQAKKDALKALKDLILVVKYKF